MKELSSYISEKLDLNDVSLSNSRAGSDNPDDFKEGDILVSIFNQSMTLVNFYKIIKKIGSKTFLLQGVYDKVVSGNKMKGECIPDITNMLNEEPKKFMVSRKDGKLRGGKSIDCYKAMYIYDDKPIAFDLIGG